MRKHVPLFRTSVSFKLGFSHVNTVSMTFLLNYNMTTVTQTISTHNTTQANFDLKIKKIFITFAVLRRSMLRVAVPIFAA